MLFVFHICYVRDKKCVTRNKWHDMLFESIAGFLSIIKIQIFLSQNAKKHSVWTH
jgi:hypothetical protein